jgi:hypothetical protein
MALLLLLLLMMMMLAMMMVMMMMMMMMMMMATVLVVTFVLKLVMFVLKLLTMATKLLLLLEQAVLCQKATGGSKSFAELSKSFGGQGSTKDAAGGPLCGQYHCAGNTTVQAIPVQAIPLCRGNPHHLFIRILPSQSIE